MPTVLTGDMHQSWRSRGKGIFDDTHKFHPKSAPILIIVNGFVSFTKKMEQVIQIQVLILEHGVNVEDH